MKKSFYFFIYFSCLFLLFNTNLQAQVNLNKGLLYWLPINGNANDASGNGKNGSVNSGTLTTDRFGVANSAYSFTGDVGINVASLPNSGYPAGTISFWLKTSSTTGDIRLYAGPPGLIYLSLYTSGHYIGAFDNTGNGKSASDESTSAVNTGKWVNLTTKNDGNYTYMYVNGKLETTYSSAYYGSNLTNVSVPDYNSYYSAGLYGQMDDIRAYKRALSDSEVLAIYEMPHAAFGARSGCLSDSVHFSDSSVATTGSKYLWKFGDNTISNKQNPAHLYSKPGTYNVTLIVTSPATSADSITQTITIYPLPVAHFSVAINSYKNQASFTPYDTTNTSYSWDFGDTTSSSQKRPVHVYKTFVSHIVTLRVTNGYGCDSIYKIIVKINPAPKAIIGVKNGCAGSGILFIDSSLEPTFCSYQWDFGDGFTSNAQNPVHIYSLPGTYKIDFIITTPLGLIDSTTKTITIYSRPDASFTFTESGYKVSFAASDNSLESYSWDFGDSSQSLSKNPNHTYGNYGTYTVSLTATNKSGCDSTVKNTIIVEQMPIASFSASNVCLGDSMHFSFTGTAPAGSVYSWNFGDKSVSSLKNPGHLYATAGNYVVSLKVSNNQGGSDSTGRYVIVLSPPSSSFSYTLNKYTLSASPSDTSAITFNWNFGDQNSSNASDPTHTYSKSGSYTVTLTAVNRYGCSSTSQKNIIVNEAPVASFSAANFCEGDTVQFTNTSSAPSGSTYSWSYGDGFNSNIKSPFHIYAHPGKFKILLKVTNTAGQSDTISKYITIFPTPSAMFKITVNKFKVSFKPLDSTLASYSWDFGDNNNSSSKSPLHTYSDTGTYEVTLTAKNSGGCDSTFTLPVKIDGTTGVEENPVGNTSTLIVYPNPIENGKLHISFNVAESNCQLEIINVEGQALFSEKLAWTNVISTRDINVKTYPPGIYCLKLTGKSVMLTRKIVIH